MSTAALPHRGSGSGRFLFVGLIVIALALIVSLALASPAQGVKWKRITDTNLINTAEVGLARTPDANLHLIWPAPAGLDTRIVHDALSPKGAVLPARADVANWRTVNPSLELVSSPGQGLVALWGGIRTTNPGETFDGELVRSTGTANGTQWSGPALASQNHFVYVGSGVGADADPRSGQSTIVGDWGDSGPNDNGYSFGAGFPSPLLDSVPGSGVIQPEVAIDAANGTVIGGWQSIDPGNMGILGMVLGPTAPLGAPVLAPKSAVNGGSGFDFQSERTALSARPPKNGVFIAYGQGAPIKKKILLWRVPTAGASAAAKNPATLVKGKSAKGAENVSIAPGTGGKLWVFWERDGKYCVTRTNGKATKAKGIAKVEAPPGTSATYRLSGEGTAGPLDLLAHVEQPAGISTNHIQVKPKKLKPKKGKKKC